MYIHIKVKTTQRKEIIEKLDDTHLVISVKEKPERNLANTRIIEICKELYKAKVVRIISGVHSPSKLLSID